MLLHSLCLPFTISHKSTNITVPSMQLLSPASIWIQSVFPSQPPAYKYVHVWQWGQRRKQEPGSNVYFLEETARHRGSTNHASAQTHSLQHSVTHQGWTIKSRERWVRGRSQEVANLKERGLSWTDMQVLISWGKEIAAGFYRPSLNAGLSSTVEGNR